ncbi:unnamed protein product, partial [Rotaria sp. Silwood2]
GIDHIDLNDELLPSIEFQPEIIMNNDETSNKLKCELYTGSICRSIISSQYISTANRNQKTIEDTLIENLKFFTNNQLLSNECRKLLLPMICLFTYPICDNDRLNTRSVCRRSCYYFQNDACPNLFNFQHPQTYSNFELLQNMPTCDNLPPTSDDSSCMSLDQTVPIHRNVGIDHIDLNDEL